MWKDVKAILLPTNEKINIGNYILSIVNEEFPVRLRYGKKIQEPVNCTHINYHLYIVSLDEEIKFDDWYIGDNVIYVLSTTPNGKNPMKILATTNIDLELPNIPQQFIEEYISEYNKGNILEKVEVRYEEYIRDIQDCIGMDGEPNGIDFHAFKLKISKDNFIAIKRKETKLYTREEVVTLCLKMQHEYTEYKKNCHYGPNMREIAEWTDNWIQQNL